jgi:hypothetical protein
MLLFTMLSLIMVSIDWLSYVVSSFIILLSIMVGNACKKHVSLFWRYCTKDVGIGLLLTSEL